MFRMTLITLAALYLVLAIAGRDVGKDEEALAAAPQAAAQTAPIATALSDPAKLTPVTEAAYTTDTPAPAVTPVRLAPMPGPSLRPAPEYRQPPEPVAVAGGTLWAVNTSSLNVRSGPSTGNAVVDRLARGEQVLVTAESGGWVRIRIEGDGTDGWVSKKLLRPAR